MGHKQCDQIGWLLKLLVILFRTKVSHIFGDLLGCFETHYFVDTFEAILGKFGPFIPTSRHKFCQLLG